MIKCLRTVVFTGFMGAGSPASWELTLYHRTVVAAAGSVAAGSLAPWELTSYLAAGSVAAGSLASWELTSHPRSRLRVSRLPAP